uniref:Pumilio domain-containing protein C6G9.14 n=2 Tax=Cajanus cajan TaxID=3821 RepID=A0A151U8W4_CAJCA|nr:Pumilio domain-containing protein C6G9.14 [Cajanus cajan]
MWAHDLPNDFSRLNLFDGEIDSYPHHHHNTALFEKGFTFSSPDNLGNYMYHHILDQRRKHLQGTSGANANYQILRDRFVSPQSHGGVRTPVRFSPLNSTANNNPSHYYYAAKEKASIDSEQLSHVISPRRVVGDPSGYRCDNSIIIQGREAKQCFENGYSSTRGFRRSPRDEASIHGVGPKSFSAAAAAAASGQNQNNGDFTLPMLLDFYSVPDAQCYIYNLAKDQNGCRFLQRLVDEGTYQDMCMVFEGIIGSVVELMIDSFGNYLVQKLLDVCTDQQRLQIVFMLTNQPGQLVRISLNTHGTRVVQKLIETLNSAEQVSMVKSAIQPGFLDLIRDLNGNHVIQRCLQCLSCQDNQFIFDAAVKFCVEIATHRHGCCVMQRCIDYSVGKNRDKLVTEICKHGLLLSQDPFGNYVVQYVIEMDTPAASAKLLGLFKGNYVNLSTQKFSSHVVEKCLKHIGDTRSRIVRELLSAPHFEQLLQDPFANYVIQSALAVTKGPLHGTLVEAVRPHKILRTSPYCKRIFSGSLLKK